MNISLDGSDWLTLFVQFLLLSCLAVGGAITTAPEMHRILVDSHQWLTNEQFVTSIALAQAAPGPNILFVALVGWKVGLNAGGGLANGLIGWTTAFAGALVTMAGMLIPSTTLTFVATRWGHRNRDRRAVRAFKQGMAPIVVGLLIATGWVLVRGDADSVFNPTATAVAVVSMLIVWRTRVHLLWLLGAGALLGAMGLV